MRKNPDAKYGNAKPLMGWQILSLPKRTQFFKKVCLTAFAESEFGNPFYSGRSWIMGWQILSLPKRTQFFKKSMPDSICRIGVRQPILQW